MWHLVSGHHCLHLSYLIGLESFCRLAIFGASDVADCFGVVGVDSVGGVAGGFASGVASGGRCAQWWLYVGVTGRRWPRHSHSSFVSNEGRAPFIGLFYARLLDGYKICQPLNTYGYGYRLNLFLICSFWVGYTDEYIYSAED